MKLSNYAKMHMRALPISLTLLFFPSIDHCLIKHVCTYLHMFLFCVITEFENFVLFTFTPTNIENSSWQSIPVDTQQVFVD